jgi:hypothetical protein
MLRPEDADPRVYCAGEQEGRVRTITKRVAVAIGLAAAASARCALAQGDDMTSARALFEEARGLMRAGRYEAACPKLEAARAIYAGPGVLLNLGDCYEKTGRMASAWTTFEEALTHATAEGRAEYEAEARRRHDSLASRVARLVVRTAVEAPDVVVRCDGNVIDRRVWSEGVAVDPGSHFVEAAAPGHSSWSASTATYPGATTTVDVPELPVLPPTAIPERPPLAPPSAVLVPVPPPAASPLAPAAQATPSRTAPKVPSPQSSVSANRTAGWAALATAGGLVLVGVAGLLTREWEAEIYDDGMQCEPVGSLTRRDRCGTNRDIGSAAEATAIAAFAGAAVSVGIAGMLLLPQAHASSTTSAPRLACHTVGIGVACGATF